MNLIHGISRNKKRIRCLAFKAAVGRNGSAESELNNLNANINGELPFFNINTFNFTNANIQNGSRHDHTNDPPQTNFGMLKHFTEKRRETNTAYMHPSYGHNTIEHEFELARSLKNDAKALVLLVEHRQKRLPMAIGLSNRMLYLCKELDYYTMANQVFSELLESRQVNERTFRCMVEFHAKERFFARACHTFAQMLDHVEMPTLDTFNLLLTVLMKAGRYEMVWPLAVTMRESGVIFDKTTLALLIRITVYSRNFEKYTEIMRMITDLGHRHATFHPELLSAFNVVGRVQDANRLFDKMKAENEEMSVKIYVKMVNINFVSRKFERVLELFHGMKSDGLKPNKYIYARVFLALEELGRHDEVMREKQLPEFKQAMRANFVYHDRNDWATRGLNNFEFLGERSSGRKLQSLPVEEEYHLEEE